MPDALSSSAQTHVTAFYPLDDARVEGRQSLDALAGPLVENDGAERQAAIAPASPFAQAHVALGSPAVRAGGAAQARRTASTFSKFFSALANAVQTKLLAAWDRIAGKPGTRRASTMDTQFRVAHAAAIGYLENLEPGSLATNKQVMNAVFDHAAVQNTPLTRDEITHYIAAGEKAINAIYKDYRGNQNTIRIDVEDKTIEIPNSQYLTRAIAWTIAARVAEAQLRNADSALAPNSLNAEGEIIMPDPAHRLQKFLAGAPSATVSARATRAPFEHVRSYKSEMDTYENRGMFDGFKNGVPELLGCIDDARLCLPGAGGAMLFDCITAGRFLHPDSATFEDTKALSVKFTRSQHMRFERTSANGVAEKDSWIGNIAQGFSRLARRVTAPASDPAQISVRAASMDNEGLKDAIADPYRKLMLAVGRAGLDGRGGRGGNKVQGFVAETMYGIKIDGHIRAGFDTISESVTQLLGVLKAQRNHPQAKDFEAESQALAITIHLYRAKFGDSTTLRLKRIGAERHISLRNVDMSGFGE